MLFLVGVWLYFPQGFLFGAHWGCGCIFQRVLPGAFELELFPVKKVFAYLPSP